MSGDPGLMVALHVAGRRCLVIGEGELADERADRLARAGAVVERIAAAAYAPAVVEGAFLVLCTEPALADAVTRAARAAGALAYAHDDPDRSDLALPALARRGPLTIAIATAGQAPALARRLREELARVLEATGPALDAFLGELAAVRARLQPGDVRRATLRALAGRLRLAGTLEIDPPPLDDPAPSKVDSPRR